MSCPRPDVLSAFAEGVLPATLSAQVGSHLEHCSICQRLQRDLRLLSEPGPGELHSVDKRVFPRAAPARPSFAIAAIAAALVVGVFAISRRTPDVAPITVSYKLPLEPAPLRLPFAAMVVRGSSDAVSQTYLKALGSALDPYRSRDHAKAASELRTLGSQYPAAVEPPFYEGVSRLLISDLPGAEAALERARSIGGEALNDDIAWYLAIVYERRGQWTKSLPLLNSLCSVEGLHRERACSATTPQ